MCAQPEWRRAYLGLGSNLGNRLENLRHAVRVLAHHPDVRLQAVSAVYETEPVGEVPQPDFLNAVVAISTRMQPEELLELCLRIEDERGRVRRERWGPRTLDVDVLLVEGVQRHTERLRLPHPELSHRRFVLRPLADVANGEPLDPLGASASALLASCRDSRSVRPFGPAELLWPAETQVSK